MKAYKITLFIFIAIALLGLVSFVFPPAGIDVAGVHFDFANLSEVLKGGSEEAKVPTETPEQLLQRRMEEMRLNEEAQYRTFFSESQARIYFPNDSIALFDSFFAALDMADTHSVRVLHYGDSQIEEDRISNILREELQTKFGGHGVGLVPIVQTIPSMSMGQSCDAELPRYMVYGGAENRAQHRRYGISGQFVQLDTVANIRFYVRTKDTTPEHVKYFSKLTLLVGNVDQTVHVSVAKAGSKTIQAPSTGLRMLDFQLPDSTKRTGVTLSGNAELYGFLLDGGNTGVQVDNIPMRGCSGTIFTGMDKNILSTFYKTKNVRLIIMQFGGNSMPYLKTSAQIANYKQSMIRQITYMKNVAPDAQILFIGPSDMTTKVKGTMQTYPMLPEVVEALKEAANSCNAAYWDMYSVMGGHNSMINWVNATPPLASSDYIHFTQAGAQRVGDMLYKSLMLYYDYYKFRQKHVE